MNKLINRSNVEHGKRADARTALTAEASMKKEPRCFLYSPDCPQGKIFVGADAITDAEDNGWVDSPALLKPRAERKEKTGGKGAAGDKSK